VTAGTTQSLVVTGFVSLSPAHANRRVCEDLCSVFTVVVVNEKKNIDICSHIVVPRFAWLEIFTTSCISSLHSVTNIFFSLKRRQEICL
jgi:hypothetical protein